MVALETYDPDWEARWERAHAAWTLAHEADDCDARAVHNKAMQAAYHAQFRTADEYRDHWLRFEPLVDAGVGLVPDIPDGLTLDEVQDRLNAWRESVQRTKAEARRPSRFDPPGLEAFLTPASPGVCRYSGWFTLDSPGSWPRTKTFQIAVEYSDRAAHVCFITAGPGRSVTNAIEELANQFYGTWVRQPSPLRQLLGLRRPGEYRPTDLTFYDYLPWRECLVDDFGLVQLRWSAREGFHSPGWRSFKTVPPYLADLADYRTDPSLDVAPALVDHACAASWAATEIAGAVRTDCP